MGIGRKEKQMTLIETEQCNKCEVNQYKHSKNRPLFCCSCELKYCVNKLIPELPGYNLLSRVAEWAANKLNKI